MTVGTALAHGSHLLERGGIPEPRRTAEDLLSHCLGRDRTYLYTWPDRELDGAEWSLFGRLLDRRLAGQPLQYVTGRTGFYGREFHVAPPALIPRPETEHVVERALSLGLTNARVLDMGTGTGILAVTLALELDLAHCVATDLSYEALRIAWWNAHELGANVEFVVCDLGSALAPAFDLIVSNPPYIPSAEIGRLEPQVRDHEPRLALDGGSDGLDVYRRLIPEAARLLAAGGWLVLEVGFDQGESVPALLGRGWSDLSVERDLAGHPRVVSARYAR